MVAECQTDAKGQLQISEYDFAGRTLARKSYTAGNCSSPANLKADARWQYDTAAFGLGKADLEQDLVSQYSRSYSYDTLGRSTGVTTTFKGANDVLSSHYEKATFDEYGRPYQTFDAARQNKTFSSNGLQNEYTANGYLKKITEVGTNTTYYEVIGANERGDITHYNLNGGVTQTEQKYNATTGRLETINTNGVFGTKLQQYTLKWDTLGNLASRESKYTNSSKDWTESFTYDAANRLSTNTFTQGGNANTVTVTYDSIGNIASKTGIGAYGYNSSLKPHAVRTANGKTYDYDANGNNTTTTGGGAPNRIITYTVEDQAETITVQGKQNTQFAYAPGGQRYKRVDTALTNNAKTTTLYIGSVEKIYYPDGQIEWKRAIAGIGQVTLKVNTSGAELSRETHYFHKDHLGSILFISNQNGQLAQEQAFDPWGQRRELSSATAVSEANLASYYKSAKPITQRGFTGHEMLDEVGIVHMNGRIYDAQLGRFLQADPIIQAPYSIGSLNRYSYCMNNPLNATDPTGFSWLSKAWKNLKPFIGAIVSIVVVAATGGFGSIFMTNIWYAAALGAATGGLNAAINGGNILKGMAQGAFSSWAGVGGGIMGSMMAGGILAEYNGGSFMKGFASAGVGALGGGGKGFGGMIRAAVAGGVASRITGGKFANGAYSGAFMYAVQKGVDGAFEDHVDSAQDASASGKKGPEGTAEERLKTFNEAKICMVIQMI